MDYNSSLRITCNIGKWNFVKLVLLFSLAFELTGCSNKNQNRVYQSVIIDSVGLISKVELEAMRQKLSTPGLRFIIQTVDSLPEQKVGLAADEIFEKTLEKSDDINGSSKRTVFILASRKPTLLQARLGKDLFLKGYFGGIISGSKYVEIQSSGFRIGLNKSLDSMVSYLANQVPKTYHKSNFNKLSYNILTTNLYFELMDLGTPSDDFYGNKILKKLIILNVKIAGFSNTWILPFILSALMAFLIGKLFKGLLGVITKRTMSMNPIESSKPVLIVLLIGLATFVFEIFIAIPPLQSAILLSGSRLEDQIALNAAGIKTTDYLNWPKFLSAPTTFGLMLITILIGFIKNIIKFLPLLKPASFSPGEQMRIHAYNIEHYPHTAFAIETLANGRDRAPNVDKFSSAPFSYALKRFTGRMFVKSLWWGIFCWLYFIKGFTIIFLLYFMFDVISGVIELKQKKLANGTPLQVLQV